MRKLVFAFTALLTLLSIASLSRAAESAGARFDHFTTGYRLEGAHQHATCDSCHIGGVFAGTPIRCFDCHSESGKVRASSQPSHHITATTRCESCHRSYTWAPVARVDHLEVLGACSSCHDGRRASTKPITHLPTNNQCDNCHRSTSWTPAQFDHAGIVSGCFNCHNGVIATGKPITHIPATNVCEDCHRVLSFSPVARVDHLQVLGTCSSCHNGVIARGQHATHIPTTAECDSCHSTNGWLQP